MQAKKRLALMVHSLVDYILLFEGRFSFEYDLLSLVYETLCYLLIYLSF